MSTWNIDMPYPPQPTDAEQEREDIERRLLETVGLVDDRDDYDPDYDY